MTKEDKVDAVIKHDGNAFAEEDRATLMKLNEADLDQHLKAEESPESEETKVKANDAGCGCGGSTDQKTNASPLTEERIVQLVGTTIEKVVPKLFAKANAAAQAAPIRERLKANDACVLSDEDLDKLDADGLDRLERSLNPGVYSGRGSIRANAGAGEEIPDMAPLFASDDAK